MSNCQIQNILTKIGSTKQSDLDPYCSNNYTTDNTSVLEDGQTCYVSTNSTNFPKGSVFTCQNGSIVGPITFNENSSSGNFSSSSSGTFSSSGPTISRNITVVRPKSDKIRTCMILLLLLLLIVLFMKEKKTITSFGRKRF